MANEITVTASLTAYKSSVMGSALSRAITGASFTMSGTPYLGPSLVLVATSATVIPVANVTAPHWAWFHNTDTGNAVRIRNGSSGADVLRLLPGEACAVPLYDSGTYYGIAETAAVELEYMVLSL